MTFAVEDWRTSLGGWFACLLTCSFACLLSLEVCCGTISFTFKDSNIFFYFERGYMIQVCGKNTGPKVKTAGGTFSDES